MIANVFIDREGRLRSGWRFLLALITLFAAFLISEVVARAFSKNAALQNVISRPLAAAIMFVVFRWMAQMLDHSPDPAAYIGLGTLGPWGRELGRGVMLGVVLVSVCVLAIALVGGYWIEAGPALQVSRWTAVGVVGWVFFFGAITEELGFRSYPFRRLIECLGNLASLVPAAAIKDHARSIGEWLAILLLAGLFGAIHLGNPNATFWGVANTVLIGVLFGLLMVRLGSLWLLWGVHFGWNFTLGALYGLPVSGINQFSVLWTGRMRGPAWLTGGAYGIEASAVTTATILLAVIGVGRLRRKDVVAGHSGIQPE